MTEWSKLIGYLDWKTINICIVVYLSIILNVQVKLYLVSSFNPWSIIFHLTQIDCLIDSKQYLKQFSHPNINIADILCGERFRVGFPNMMSQWIYDITMLCKRVDTHELMISQWNVHMKTCYWSSPPTHHMLVIK